MDGARSVVGYGSSDGPVVLNGSLQKTGTLPQTGGLNLSYAQSLAISRDGTRAYELNRHFINNGADAACDFRVYDLTVPPATPASLYPEITTSATRMSEPCLDVAIQAPAAIITLDGSAMIIGATPAILVIRIP